MCSVGGCVVIKLIELLVRKWEKETIFLTVLKIAFNSASVESAAIKDWIFVVHPIITPFRNTLFDCIDRRSGSIFPKAESLKYAMWDGNIYSIDCVGEN